MKPWQTLILGIFIGLLAAGLILLVAKSTPGQAIILNPPSTPAPFVVYVTGAVSQPGLYSLPLDKRVKDAIDAAGGLMPDADISLLNLAAPIRDGERIWIPSLTEATPTPNNLTAAITPTPLLPSPDHPLNINTASQTELETLPGIGLTRAQQIIAYRQNNGLFTNIEDLMRIPGIGQGIFDKLKDLITVEPQP